MSETHSRIRPLASTGAKLSSSLPASILLRSSRSSARYFTCAAIGDLHHTLAAGTATVSGVYAELGEIVCGKKPGRTSAEEITIFDSTGMALQDVASAVLVYEKAIAVGRGAEIRFGG